MVEFSHLEFLGFPCAGKSFAASAMAATDASIVVHLAKKEKRFSRVIAIASTLNARHDLLEVFKTLRNVSPARRLDQFRAALRFISRYGEMIRAQETDGPVVVDEGVVQATWGLFLLPSLEQGRPPEAPRLEEFARRFWPSPGDGFCVRYLDTPRDVLLDRAAYRSANHPFTMLQLSENVESEEAGIRLMNAILEIAEARGILSAGVL